jgi:nitroreductase
MNNFLESQNWRYATKKFNATKKISDSDLDVLKEAIRLTSSSYGLQPYKVLIIENPETRAKLQPASWEQSQITEASHLIVFANYTKIDSGDIDEFFKNICETRNMPIDPLLGYKDFMTGAINKKSSEEINIWNQKQTYLALANLMNAAADLKIDACPMEGFDPAQYNEILGLSKLNLNASLVATIGYRSEEDATQHYKKVRKSKEDLFITI